MYNSRFDMLLLVIITIYLNLCHCERRLAGGNFTTAEKRYMVYLVQSHKSYPKLKGWLCGGALVRTNKILTSAACLIESSNLYAIAGYKTYVSTKRLDIDNCTKLMRRRVIKSCVPVDYVYDPSNSTRWMTMDIGVAIVDRPYRADDIQFRILCDYIPKPVPILFAKNYIYNGQDTITLGWGFERGRRPGDIEDFNSKRLKYIVTQIQPLKPCKDAYPGMNNTIDKYMLCLDGRGYMDDDGNPMYSQNFAEWCISRRQHESNFNCTENFAKQAEIDNDETSLKQTQVEINNNGTNIKQTQVVIDNNGMSLKPTQVEIHNNKTSLKQTQVEMNNNGTNLKPTQVEIGNNNMSIKTIQVERDNNNMSIKLTQVEIDNNGTSLKQTQVVIDNNGTSLKQTQVVIDNNGTSLKPTQVEIHNNKTSLNKTQMDSRRQYMYHKNASYALCQNDHGGPLIAYVGSTEMLIGVAVNNLYPADTYRCIGPSLYTSTVSTGNIIKCMLAQNSHTRRSCSRTIEEEGFRILRRSYDWQEGSAKVEEDPADLEQ